MSDKPAAAQSFFLAQQEEYGITQEEIEITVENEVVTLHQKGQKITIHFNYLEDVLEFLCSLEPIDNLEWKRVGSDPESDSLRKPVDQEIDLESQLESDVESDLYS